MSVSGILDRLPRRTRQNESHSTFAFLCKEMAATPGRARNTLLLVAQVIVTILIGEVFRLPDLPVFVFICFFLSGNDAASNTSTAVMGGSVIVVGTALTIVFMMASLSEPGLRLPFMLLLTLAAGFLSRAMTMGSLANILLFWVVYMGMSADLLGSVGYSLDAYVGNTTDSAVPDAAFLPPEEALLHSLLWVGTIFVLALVILVIANRLAGHDPLTMLRAGLLTRLDAVARSCDEGGRPDGKANAALQSLALQGVAGLRQAHDLAARLHPELSQRHVGPAMIRTVARLVMIMLAWGTLHDGVGETFLKKAGATLRRFVSFYHKQYDPVPDRLYDETELQTLSLSFRTDPKLYPLAREMIRCLTIIHGLLVRPETTAAEFAPEIRAAARGFFRPDALSNPEYPRAAIRIALSVIICYAITRFTSWPGIQTAVVTCFLVSLGTVGDSVHKMLLRIVGALIGAACGIGTILVLMPYLTDSFDLILAVIPVAAFAGWIKSGSERISYAGVQIAMAYFMTILQGYGPTLDMETARNRAVGILIGNIVVYIIAALLWPVSTTYVARDHLTKAVRQLGTLLVLRRTDPEAAVDIEQEVERETFGRAIAATRTALQNAPFEKESLQTDTHMPDITNRLVTDVQRLAIPVAVITDMRHPCGQDAHCYLDQVRDWLTTMASWLETGTNCHVLLANLPAVPVFANDTERTVWFSMLDSDLRTFVLVHDPSSMTVSDR